MPNLYGELGLSYMGGIYNKYQEDGLVLDRKRLVNVFAVDFNTTLPKTNSHQLAAHTTNGFPFELSPEPAAGPAG